MAHIDRTPEELAEHAPFTPALQDVGFHGGTPAPGLTAVGTDEVRGISDEDKAIAAALLRDYTPALERLRDL
ncbi:MULTISPECIES: hypothetical protein [Pseudonocardia]|uniref:Uncharacterized protein n=2 Tax=Pseudonocardia TaxID=1847 RepID=A0A1Y2MQ36_PSEAH|nr:MULTISPECIES: hypothetical protein [Pseudonocardia]OSY37281.1 hypothetical protein BG845_04792 [Pseudonocardia autotrophica]TDN72422.1 hypothetical protein C8E95_1479 [Pseudonocardia autotrophica]BBG03131.1 hypothetical protein Pdca_43400 [Pseudonocardia autotrophica]GEC23750.1 hypothetical protein PSA01_07790 [Pseudonocardia saturnea]